MTQPMPLCDSCRRAGKTAAPGPRARVCKGCGREMYPCPNCGRYHLVGHHCPRLVPAPTPPARRATTPALSGSCIVALLLCGLLTFLVVVVIGAGGGL